MADEKLTLWGRAEVAVRSWRKNTRRRVREWWLSTEPPGRANEYRGTVEGGYHRRDLVRWVVTDRGLPLDLDFTGYLRLHRRLVWDEVRTARLGLLGAVTGLVAFFTVGYLIARHFHESDVGGAVLLGFFGMVPILVSVLVLMFLLQRLPRTGLFVLLVFHVAVEAAAGLVVYAEVVGRGPVHKIVEPLADHRGTYAFLHGLLLYAAMTMVLLLSLPVVAVARRRRLRRNATANAVDRLFWCVMVAHDEQRFMLLATRRRLVSLTREVARILQHGLWRSAWVASPLASSELRKRCVHAAQSMEILCARLALPDRTTHEEYLEKVLRLADTLLSGRLGELPDDPERVGYAVRSRMAIVGRLVVGLAISAAPLALYLLSEHLIPDAAEVPILILCVAWLVNFGLAAASRRNPEGSSRFTNVLGIFGDAK